MQMNVEKERLANLYKYEILDTPADGYFDDITSLSTKIFNVPISIITLVDTDRIWFKSAFGIDGEQISRDPGLCSSAIMSDDIYIVENASIDPRTLTNPLVSGVLGLRFYAAAPLKSKDGYNLGTLCIIDKKPRTFSNEERRLLKHLGDIVMDEMHLRLAVRETALNVKNLAAEISEELKTAGSKIDQGSKEDVMQYLDASRMYLLNIQNQLNNI